MNGSVLGVSVALALLALPLHAEPPGLDVHLECEHAARPGRVLCTVTSRARSGALVWSDALVVRAPAFAPPLRSRVLTELSALDSTELVSKKIALVATGPGEGRLELLVRGVICRPRGGTQVCAAETASVTANVLVSPAATP